MFHVITFKSTICKCALGAVLLNRWEKVTHRDCDILHQLESSFVGGEKAGVGMFKLSCSENGSELETVTQHL